LAWTCWGATRRERAYFLFALEHFCLPVQPVKGGGGKKEKKLEGERGRERVGEGVREGEGRGED
jgi:hypothetical protein